MLTVSEQYSLETVVLVKKNHTGGLQKLKNSKYCRLQPSIFDQATDRVIKEFERKVVRRRCNDERQVFNSISQEEAISTGLFFTNPSYDTSAWKPEDHIISELSKS